ncbi:MAG: glycosyltransferase family 4 protein [Desulfobacterales bacterium]
MEQPIAPGLKMSIDRILMTADTIGGVWTYALELAEALAPYGIEVALATMGQLPDPIQKQQIRSIPNITLFESRFKLEWMERPWQDVTSAGKWLLMIEKRIRPDLVHLNGFAHGALPFRAPVLIVAHSCVYSWFHAVKGRQPPEHKWADYRSAITTGLKNVDAVTAPSRVMLETLKCLYGPFAARDPIYNARSGNHFRPGRKKKVIFAAGRIWDEAKNIGLLARIAHQLPCPVLVAGDTRHPSGGCTQMDGIRMLGKLSPPELGKQLAQSAIFVLPARYEPFGLCALEAAMAGCALVLGDIPSLREIWGDAAVFVAPEDSNHLEHVLLTLLSDESLRRRVAASCRRRAEYFSIRRMAENYLELYAGVIEQGYENHARSTVGIPPC